MHKLDVESMIQNKRDQVINLLYFVVFISFCFFLKNFSSLNIFSLFTTIWLFQLHKIDKTISITQKKLPESIISQLTNLYFPLINHYKLKDLADFFLSMTDRRKMKKKRKKAKHRTSIAVDGLRLITCNVSAAVSCKIFLNNSTKEKT